ncbi:hypothetical protein B0T21DRAFT_408387 [Apiosordaria backusii]|uniref:Uncharacterized protein n=1 Tax=Apiosordaria backusii TaxID=314023 RepID=A0AA40K493_9PEZI|nr:hypothetical protein B0T21DRAFT_408387 [Apiosordaria backusii]
MASSIGALSKEREPPSARRVRALTIYWVLVCRSSVAAHVQDTTHRITDAEGFRPLSSAASRNSGEKLVGARNRSHKACQQTSIGPNAQSTTCPLTGRFWNIRQTLCKQLLIAIFDIVPPAIKVSFPERPIPDPRKWNCHLEHGQIS